MASANIPQSADVQSLAPLSPQYEMFAALIVNGSTAEAAADIAGFTANYSHVLTTRPEIKARIQELLSLQSQETEAFGGIATRAWIESQMVVIIRHAMHGRPEYKGTKNKPGRPEILPDHNLARLALMDLARMKGMIVEKKQTAKLSIKADATGNVDPEAMKAHLANYLDQLEPGARKEIEMRAKKADVMMRAAKKAKQLDAPATDVVDASADAPDLP
jgi:hypothetical protein